MRKIVLMMSVSLDGYMEGPNREIDWHTVDDELHTHFNDVLRDMGVFLSGRVTYELMAGFWPTADRDPAASRITVDFAAIWRNKPKLVFSRTLQRAEWHTTIVREVVVEDIEALKAQEGGDLVVGGADLAAEFMRHDLIDEFRIYVHPVLLGRGKPLFPQTPQTPRTPQPPQTPQTEAMTPPSTPPPIPPLTLTRLRLIETRTFGNGVVLLRHGRNQPPASRE